MMNVLAVTNLYPNSMEKGRGIFNKQQFDELKQLCGLTVVAPLPWTPVFINSVYNLVPGEEVIDDLKVYHPRYFMTPKIGRRFYGYWFYSGIKYIVRKIHQENSIDLIFATWGYPDCYGAYRAAAELNIPMVGRVHGTDINVGGRNAERAKLMAEAFRYADAVVTNSRGLKSGVEKMGISPDKVSVIVNGVNTGVFRRLNRENCRGELNLSDDEKHILFIGNFVEIKGLNYLIDAVAKLPEYYTLHLIGSGGLSRMLASQANALGIGARVKFHGRLPHDKLAAWFNAADVFCLPSLNEGCPNVILESLACGTPVAASAVGAIPDLITGEDKGQLFQPGNPDDMAEKIMKVIEHNDSGSKVNFEALSWKENAAELFRIFEKAVKS